MDNERIVLGLTVAELVLRYGLPAAMQLIADWQNEDPTMQDIEALRKRVPHPSTYLGEG